MPQHLVNSPLMRGRLSPARPQKTLRMAWYERLIEPLPNEPVVRPPDGLWAFYLFFIRPVKWLVLTVLVLSFAAAIIEMGLLVFMGWLVDWMTSTPPAQFFADHGWALLGMAGVVLVVRPMVALLNRSLNNLTLVPGLT